jgi:hypothetical protein
MAAAKARRQAAVAAQQVAEAGCVAAGGTYYEGHCLTLRHDAKLKQEADWVAQQQALREQARIAKFAAQDAKDVKKEAGKEAKDAKKVAEMSAKETVRRTTSTPRFSMSRRTCVLSRRITMTRVRSTSLSPPSDSHALASIQLHSLR